MEIKNKKRKERDRDRENTFYGNDLEILASNQTNGEQKKHPTHNLRKENEKEDHLSNSYRSNSVNNKPSEAGVWVKSFPDSITLIPSLYARYLLTCIGTCI